MRAAAVLALCLLVCGLCVHAAYIPVYVMLPLDTISQQNQLSNPGKLKSDLMQLKNGGVDGVMTDVWWGLVERTGPRQYNFTAYQQLVDLLQEVGLKLQVVLSFHQCGGNVGDSCDIPLPPWVLSVGNNNPDIFYTDQNGHRDHEYLSLGVDHQPVFGGRTAVQLYGDFMQAFAGNFSSQLGSLITLVEVGLGPAGEMRYPSYQLSQWTFCGIGAFQCYDKYMLASLQSAASQAGHPEWGKSGPSNAGSYNDMLNQAPFFEDNGFDNYQSDYGKFFLNWYSQLLIQHGDDILGQARSAFGSRVEIAAKIAGIHWWYMTASHPAELTAGYYNTRAHEGYGAIAAMLAKHHAEFDFTCMEMRDNEQPASCACGPAELVDQTEMEAFSHGISYGGENALPRYDTTAYQQIESQSFLQGSKPISSFTYLRLSDTLLSGQNWSNFCNFVQQMHNLN